MGNTPNVVQKDNTSQELGEVGNACLGAEHADECQLLHSCCPGCMVSVIMTKQLPWHQLQPVCGAPTMLQTCCLLALPWQTTLVPACQLLAAAAALLPIHSAQLCCLAATPTAPSIAFCNSRVYQSGAVAGAAQQLSAMRLTV